MINKNFLKIAERQRSSSPPVERPTPKPKPNIKKSLEEDVGQKGKDVLLISDGIEFMLGGGEILQAKKIGRQGLLGLKTWVSDSIRPGQRGYQLLFRNKSLNMQFPTNWENYSEIQVREMYDSVSSIKDWYKIQERFKN